MAIYDCFQYFNEDHTVDLRFNILDKHVDYFIISESTKTHQGKDKKLNYGQNLRSSEHLNLYGKEPFNVSDYDKYLKHEKMQNLAGLEIDMVYEWELGSMLIFDRTRLHCASSLIDGKKIGLTTFTKK